MLHLNTTYPTIVHNDYLLDPSILDKLPSDGRCQNKKRNVVFYDYKNKLNPYLIFIRDICSGFLELHNFKHNKNKWYTDVIRYHLNNDTKRVSSGLAWHCENDNYPNVITILLYNNAHEYEKKKKYSVLPIYVNEKTDKNQCYLCLQNNI